METAKLRKFAQFARRSLIEQVGAKLKLVLAEESPARRESPLAIKKLEEAIAEQGKEQVVERVAYIWFNRLVALRFMDVNRYNRIGVVSPAEGQFQPEILADAKMGHIDEEMVSESTRQKIFALLDGKTPSQDPQGEAYRLLVVAACNYWYSAMPFLFERIDDYTELLMPDDLLSGNSILAYTREAMTPDACEDVEVIGWLYQFYISEKKDQVFADLKKNKKVTPENIPAATQLFTPHWIVRYLVENSLGRLWMLNRPDSGLIERMDYYIRPEEPETDFLQISSPEEIKICDPACGSGHMLTYAFDLLYAIYEEEGYEPAEISEKILTNNLYGIEIDERAGELAAFALTMKARAKQRRFFRKPVQPNVVVLENVTFTDSEMQDMAALVGKDLFTNELRRTLGQFEQAKNFGSLIMPMLSDSTETLRVVAGRDFGSDMLLKEIQSRVADVLRMAEVLSQKYHVVVANPPYAGAKGLNGELGDYIKSEFPNNKADLFAAFVERSRFFALQAGVLGFMTPFTWMFLSSYEKLRSHILHNCSLISLVRPEYHSFFDSAYVPVCAFVFANQETQARKSIFFDLSDFYGAKNQAPNLLKAIKDQSVAYCYTLKPSEFDAIPGSPVAFWLPPGLRSAFKAGVPISELSPTKQGIKTGNNERFLRLWPEVARTDISLGCEGTRWCPVSKGGAFRKWYGNNEYVLDWEDSGRRVRGYTDDNGKQLSRPQNTQFFFKGGLTWSTITVSSLSMRLLPDGYAFESTGSICSTEDQDLRAELLSFLNSCVVDKAISAIAPTMNYGEGAIGKLPYLKPSKFTKETPQELVALAKSDWDGYESSWDFTTLPLLSPEHRGETLEHSYARLRIHWQSMTDEMQRLEEENNRIFIEAYGLQNELSREVPIEEVTLTCNPAYRYGIKGTEKDRETRLRADTIAEFFSYAVGCMFGRYALDKPGLILANQGETIEDYLQQIPEPSFPADEDNVIPMLDGDWFTDDITERFREFLRIAFGEEHYEENLRFVEQALGKDIRKYFLKDFYNDHVRRYKKRPIYWLFSSPKGSFNALIYMHRYQPHTVGTVLEYLRDFKDEKLQARKNHLEAVSISAGASQGDKTKALKEIEKINKILAELDDYERDVLYPLATEQVEIDLDDGVKTNYPKFGEALKKITGLSG